jgi:hypothetical protein
VWSVVADIVVLGLEQGCCCQLTTHIATLSSVGVTLLQEGHQCGEAGCWYYDVSMAGLRR